MDKEINKKCINIIIDDALNTDDKESYLAFILVNGLFSKPLKEFSQEELLSEVYDRLNYEFSTEESETFSENEAAFLKWIENKSKKVKDWYSLVA